MKKENNLIPYETFKEKQIQREVHNLVQPKIVWELTDRGRLIHELVGIDHTLTEANKADSLLSISPSMEEFCLQRIGEIKKELGGIEDIELYKQELDRCGFPVWKDGGKLV